MTISTQAAMRGELTPPASPCLLEFRNIRIVYDLSLIHI